ncbi:RNA methyltransferase [bacterium]|nr:RNA methyltransferase [bacterium]
MANLPRERSEARQKRIKEVLAQKQPDLTVVLENVHDPHNIMAVIRSCDAVGVYEIHVIESETARWDNRMGKKSSAGSKKWIKTNRYKNVDSCFSHLRSEGKKIFTTHLAQNSTDLYQLNLTQPMALVFGNEHDGVSEEALNKADGNFLIPQMGMIQSLNISVACAISLFEALRQRRAAGMYQNAKFDPTTYNNLVEDWLKR